MLLSFVDLSEGNTYNEPLANFYVLTNVPKMRILSTNDTSLVYLDKSLVLNLYNLYSNQLLRNGANLYSSYYETNVLSNNNNIINIEEIIKNVYNGLYEDIYGNVVNVIENAQNEYVNSYTEIFDYIISGAKFGITLQNIAKYAQLLNNYTMASNISTFNQSLYDASLVDFDSVSLLATGLYNFTDRNGNNIKTNYNIISALASKYNTSTMKIVNSPYHYYVPYIKINPIVINYLDRYSSYANNMNDNLIANKDALILVNNKNFPQEFNEEYQMRDKYYHLATDTNRFIIESSTINISDFDINNNTGIYISNATIDGKEVKVDINNILYSNEDIEPYKYKPYYKETKYDNMNCYYKLIGAVSLINNSIYNNLELSDYIITDNLTVVSTINYANNKTFSENFYGINYNSRKLILDTDNIVEIQTSDIIILANTFYLYNISYSAYINYDKCLVSIDNQTGYLVGGILLIGKKILFGLTLPFKYSDASSLTDEEIFNYVNNNVPFLITDSAVLTSLTINNLSTYNKYFVNGTTLTSNVMFNYKNELLLQTYGYSIYFILGKHLIYSTSNDDLLFYSVLDSTEYLPPLNITKSTISYYDVYEDTIKNANNKNYWITLKNTSFSYEFQIKDLNTEIFANGRYLVYFCDNINQPEPSYCQDIYRIGVESSDQVLYTLDTIKNAIFALSMTSLQNPNYKYINFFFNIDEQTLHFLTHHTVNNGGYEDIYFEPQQTYIKTIVIYDVTDIVPTTIQYERPIMITVEEPLYAEYTYKNYDVPIDIRFIGDSLIYLEESQYIALTENTVMTNITSLTNTYITDSLTSKSNFFTVNKTIKNGNEEVFEFLIIPNQLVLFDTFNLIEFLTDNNQKIFLWLYIRKTSNFIPFKFYNSFHSFSLIEPLYYVTYQSYEWELVATDAEVYTYVFNYTDTKYFTRSGDNLLIYISQYEFANACKSYSDQYLNHEEIEGMLLPTMGYRQGVINYNISKMNEWSYIKNTNINNQFIDDLTLQKFDIFIFKSANDNYYLNVKKSNTETGIELESRLDITEADIYIYNYTPIFINIPISYNVNNNNVYIYCNRLLMQRNEVIRIGYYYVQIIRWSEFYDCYIGNILYGSEYITMINGYYSLGIFTNYLIANTFLKGINYNQTPYVFNSSINNDDLLFGDYYIENNELKQSKLEYYETKTTNYIFRLPQGSYASINNYFQSGTQFRFYDSTKVDLKKGYTIIYPDYSYAAVDLGKPGYARYSVMVTNADNNIYICTPILNFLVNPTIAQQHYVPYQPFEIKDVIILDNVIQDNNFNGWIQLAQYSQYPIVQDDIEAIINNIRIEKVENGSIISATIYDGSYTIKIIDKNVIYSNIKHDFNNPLLNVYDNTNIANKIFLTVYTDETYVYFTTSDTNFQSALSNNKIQFVYYQSIIINDIWYRVIDVNKTTYKIYIELLSSDNIFENETLCSIIISAANVNNINLVSNNHKLRTSHTINYPIIKKTNIKTEITSLFKGSNNNYVYNFKDALIKTSTVIDTMNNYVPLYLSSPNLVNIINYFKNNNYNLDRTDYYENYIPLWENNIIENTDIGYNFYQLNLPAVKLTPNQVIDYTTNYNPPNVETFVYNFNIFPRPENPVLTIVNNILLQEITKDGAIYQHNISVDINNYHIKITSVNYFQDITTSFFYLNNIVPCNITKFNNLLILPPDYHFYREINIIDRKIINLTYSVKIELIDPPTFINNKWKYYCKYYNSNNEEAYKYNKMDLYVNGLSATYEFIDNDTFYLYIDDFQETISTFYYYTTASINRITPETTTIKSEYSNLTKSELNIITGINNDYNLKQSNILYLSKVNNNNILVFKDQTTPTPQNVNLGDIDDTNYIGRTNTILYSAINTNNEYVIDTLYSILDTTSISSLYIITTNLIISNPLYYILEPEISLSVPALELLINDEDISIISLFNETKPWTDWTLITTRYNTYLEPYLNNYDLIYDGTTFTTIVSTSYFTNNEIINIKSFMTLMYNNTIAQNILTELYLVEQYLLTQIVNYTTQRYFWDDITNILSKIVANYNGTFDWTITNNVLCIVDEFTLYPENFELINNKYYIRRNYLPIEYTINYAYSGTNIRISRDPAIIDTNINTSINYIINSVITYDNTIFQGTNINNIIQTLLNYSISINKITSPLPIYYKYMDSIKYYIAKLFYDIFNTNNYKFNNLTEFNRIVSIPETNQYFGKYYDYKFNKRYFGINGFNQYNELTNIETDSMYVMCNIINKLYSSYVDENTINKLITNNIFKYTIMIKSNGNELTDLIKSTNTYTIDIKDNYNHLVDPTIDNVYINTNSLDFSTTEMVQPTDISILSSEPYNIINKVDYGIIITVTSSLLLSSNYTIISNNIPISFIKENSILNYDIAFNTTIYNIKLLLFLNDSGNTKIYIANDFLRYNYIIINNTMYKLIYQGITDVPDYNLYNVNEYLILSETLILNTSTNYDLLIIPSTFNCSDKVVIKTATVISGNTFLTFATNCTEEEFNEFIYITINNKTYQIKYLGGYYIDGIVSVVTNEVYTVFKTLSITLNSTNYYYLSELTLERDIVPIKYNQTDISLPLSFNLDNTNINNISILTTNKLKIIYTIQDITKSIGTIVYHNYRLNESIPYNIDTATPVEHYYYSVPNTYKMTINDTISFEAIYVKISTIFTTIETSIQLTEYETINPPVITTYTGTIVTKETLFEEPTDSSVTTTTIDTTINKQWSDRGCWMDNSTSYNINQYPYTSNMRFLDQAIIIANEQDANVLGLREGFAFQYFLFINNTFTTTWPGRYTDIGPSASCQPLGSAQYNHVYTLNKTTTTVTTTTTTTITHTILYPTIYSVDDTNIVFYINEYILLDNLNSVNMIITKDYNLDIISYVGTKIIANIPNNIVNANSTFKINNIYDTTVVFENYLIITTDADIPGPDYILTQIITDDNHKIINNENNQEYTIITNNDTLYYNKSPYFIPIIQCLDTNLKEFTAKYYYKFENNGEFTFGEYIYIEYNDVYIKATIIVIQDNLIIIGTDNYVIQGIFTIYSANFNENKLVNILNNYYPYIKGTILEQVDNKTYKILLPMNSLFEYDYSQNTTTNKVIITFKYSEIDLINNTYPLVGFNKIPDTIIKSTTNTTNYNDIEWVDNVGVKLFKSIELLIDDNIVEKINPNIYSIVSYYFRTIFDRERLLQLITLRRNPDNSIYYYLPIPLHASLIDSHLPISSMGRSTIKIKFVLEKLENLISNKVSSNYTLNVIPNIDFNYSFITVDNKILDKFKKTELLITNFYYYQNFLLNKPEEYNHISLLSRTIELFFITNTKNDIQKYSLSLIRDNWYIQYLSNNPNDAYIFNIIDAEIESDSYRYQVLKNNLIIKNYDTRFAMYLDEKYLTYIDEDLNDQTLKFSNKITILILYFKNIYKNNTVYTFQQIIDKLNIYINGKVLLPELPADYHNRVIPYNKGLSLADGYHVYSFNYHSLISQPNGFINMKKVRDFLIYSSQVDIGIEYKLKVCTREYKILKIDNLMGKII
jgi:hypothetical protein